MVANSNVTACKAVSGTCVVVCVTVSARFLLNVCPPAVFFVFHRYHLQCHDYLSCNFVSKLGLHPKMFYIALVLFYCALAAPSKKSTRIY